MRRKHALNTTAITLALALSAAPFAAVSAQQNEAQAQKKQAQQKGERQGQQQAGQQSQTSGEDGKIDLATWRQADLYDGWTAVQLFGTPVYGSEGEDIGEIENVIIGADGKIRKIEVEAGGFADIGDTHFAVAWDEVKVGPDFERVTVPVNEDNVEDFSLFDDDEVQTGERAWRVTELMNDYVSLEDYPAYGIVEDVVFSKDGAVEAVIVYPDVAYGVGGPYAYPYRGYEYGFEPGETTYDLPYDRSEIEALGPFDYSRLSAPMPGGPRSTERMQAGPQEG